MDDMRDRRATWVSRHVVKKALGFGIVLLLAVGLSGSAPSGTLALGSDERPVETLLEAVQSMTLDVLRLQQELNHAAPAARQAVLDQLSTTLRNRRQAILELIETRPEAVLRIALPDKARAAMAPDLLGFVERPAVLEGTLEIHVADDFDLRVVTVTHLLITDDGQEIALHFVRTPEGLENNSRVRMSGVRIENDVALDGSQSSVETLSTSTTTSGLAATTYMKTAVVLFNFQNNPVEPYTPDTARATTFTSPTSANAWYQEVSFGRIGLSGRLNFDGDVYGWYTIPYDNTTCSTSTWVSAASSAAAVDGFAASDYDKVIYAFPQTDACSYWGLAGGNTAKINGSYAIKVITHELGHTFGLAHANTYACTDANGAPVAIGTSCTSTEYGNMFDTMGIGSSGHFNSFSKNYLGWFDPEAVQVASTDGIYTVTPMDTASGGVQALRIPRIVDSSGNVLRYYDLEFRLPVGFDDNSYVSSYASKGVMVYYHGYLLDATPATSGFADAQVLPGKDFYDPYEGITVATQSVSASGAVVAVTFGPGVCLRGTPSVSVTPTSQWGYAGQPLSFTLTLSNNDTADCGSSAFDVLPTLPPGWTQTPAALNVSVAPGASVTQAVTITSDPTAAPAFYSLPETMTNMQDVASQGSAMISYNILTPDTAAPTVTITKPADGAVLPRKGSFSIAATASDASGISRMQILFDGNLLKTCSAATCSAKVSVRGMTSGLHTITVNATDKDSPAPNTAGASITVSKP